MPNPQATLCYIVKEGRVLLIHKKRGIGAGKINGPGGKVDPGETPLAAAVRETQEETGVTPLGVQLRGELWFRFSADFVLHCYVYLAADFIGTPHETAEACPEWFSTEALPFERMWEDDKHWLPLLLGGQCFQGTVEVHGEHAEPPMFSTIRNA